MKDTKPKPNVIQLRPLTKNQLTEDASASEATGTEADATHSSESGVVESGEAPKKAALPPSIVVSKVGRLRALDQRVREGGFRDTGYGEIYLFSLLTSMAELSLFWNSGTVVTLNCAGRKRYYCDDVVFNGVLALASIDDVGMTDFVDHACSLDLEDEENEREHEDLTMSRMKATGKTQRYARKLYHTIIREFGYTGSWCDGKFTANPIVLEFCINTAKKRFSRANRW